ncbi:11866_t:CDS:1, partial [Racocetra fulgida]
MKKNSNNFDNEFVKRQARTWYTYETEFENIYEISEQTSKQTNEI